MVCLRTNLLEGEDVAVDAAYTELPPYDLQPSVEPVKQSGYYVAPILSIRLDQKKATSGTFLTGSAMVTPVDSLGPLVISLEVRCTEHVMSRGGIGHRDTITSRKRVMMTSMVPVDIRMERGNQYKFPYSIQLPEHDESLRCTCTVDSGQKVDEACGLSNAAHCYWPPSIGSDGQIQDSLLDYECSYSVYARIVDTHIATYSTFRFLPRLPTLDLDDFDDEKGSCMTREYRALCQTQKRRWLSSSCSDGMLVVGAKPLYHAKNLSNSGGISLGITFLPSDSNSKPRDSEHPRVFSVTSVSAQVVKSVFSAPEGMGKTLAKTTKTSVCTYKIPLDNIVQDFCLSEKCAADNWNLKVWYSLPDTPMLECPSFVSCYGGVSYDIVFKIKHSFGTTKLSVPLVLQVGGLPSYCSLTTAASIPSLISDT